MQDHIRCTNWGAMVYFVTLCIIGNIILVNLFLAILLKNFEDGEERDIEEEESELNLSKMKRFKTFISSSI